MCVKKLAVLAEDKEAGGLSRKLAQEAWEEAKLRQQLLEDTKKICTGTACRGAKGCEPGTKS